MWQGYLTVYSDVHRAVLNDSYRTNVSLLYPPHLVALACLHLSSVLMKHDLREWLDSLPCDFLNEVSKELWLFFSFQWNAF